jgi:hypothetical protein
MATISSGSISVPESGPSWLAPPGPGLVLLMDFRGGMTQAQIGQRLRISQMHVSRLRTHVLGYLRSRLLDLEGTRANAAPALAPQPPAGRASATSANRL